MINPLETEFYCTENNSQPILSWEIGLSLQSRGREVQVFYKLKNYQMYKFRPLFQSDELNTFIADIKCKPSGKTHKNVLILQVISETFHNFSEIKVCQLFFCKTLSFLFSDQKKIQIFWSKKAEFFHQITSNWLINCL